MSTYGHPSTGTTGHNKEIQIEFQQLSAPDDDALKGTRVVMIAGGGVVFNEPMLTPWLMKPAIAWTITALLLGRLILWRRKVKALPPGPTKLPLLGNLFNMPLDLNWVEFLRIGKRCNSDIIHLSALGNSIVVLNSFDVAEELLNKRSGIYSSRPQAVMTHELSGFSTFFVFQEYNDVWRSSRRLFTKHFGTGSMPSNHIRELYYSRRMLTQLLAEPEKCLDVLQQMVGSITLAMTYGLKPLPSQDPHIALASRTAMALSDIAGAGGYLVDVLPWLKFIPEWLPGAQFKRDARKTKELVMEVRNGLFDAAVKEMGTEGYSASFASESLSDIEASGGDAKSKEEALGQLKDTGAMVFQAAADTTWASLSTFMLAMVMHPEVQKRAQQELDQVLGGRLPVHEDVQDLPYLTAVFRESLRWKPVTPIGVPHKVIMDDVYNGSIIPKESIVIANQWAMLQDPDDFPEPDQFRPDRFLKDGKIDSAVRNPEDIAFGFGRRTCPGRHVARSVALLTMASILSSFDLLMKKDERGRSIKPTGEYHLSFLSHPKAFPCDIVPRSKQARDAILEWETVEGENAP